MAANGLPRPIIDQKEKKNEEEEDAILYINWTVQGDYCTDFSCSLADQVFGPEIETREVYERGAKDVALSALTGKNGE